MDSLDFYRFYEPTKWESFTDTGVERFAYSEEAPLEKITIDKTEGKTIDGYKNYTHFNIQRDDWVIDLSEELEKMDNFPDLLNHTYHLTVRDLKKGKVYRVILPILDDKYFH